MTDTQNRTGDLIGVETRTETGAPTETAGMITVAAGLPGKLKPYSLPSNSTIADLLLKAELNPEGQEVRVDGETVRDLRTPLQEGQTVMLFRPVRGNVDGMIQVAAGLPGKLKPYSLPENSTVEDVLLKAELNAEGQEVRIDGETITNLKTPLQDGQTIMLFRPVRGNVDGMIQVAAGLPGKLKPYSLPENSTVEDVLLKAELNAEGQEVRIDGETITNLKTPLQDGQTIMLFRPVRGNKQ